MFAEKRKNQEASISQTRHQSGEKTKKKRFRLLIDSDLLPLDTIAVFHARIPPAGFV